MWRSHQAEKRVAAPDEDRGEEANNDPEELWRAEGWGAGFCVSVERRLRSH